MPSYKKVDHWEFWTKTGKNNNQRNETCSFESPVCYNFPYINDKKYFKIHFWKQYIWVWCGMQCTAELSQMGDTENSENKPEELAHGLFSFHMIHFLISHPHYQDLSSCSVFASQPTTLLSYTQFTDSHFTCVNAASLTPLDTPLTYNNT